MEYLTVKQMISKNLDFGNASKMSEKLFEIYANSKTNQDVKNHMVNFLNPFYKHNKQRADKYFQERKVYNLKMMDVGNKMVSKLQDLSKEHGLNAEFRMTSSLNADVNLVGDSDIDISMLVDGCTFEVAVEISKYLAKLQFVYRKFVNPVQPLNCYYSFTMIENEVEFEVKLRDAKSSQKVIQLHEHIETKLQYWERAAITYGKLVFKELSKKSTTLDTEKYAFILFKKLVYDMYFAEIEGCFLFELHY